MDSATPTETVTRPTSRDPVPATLDAHVPAVAVLVVIETVGGRLELADRSLGQWPDLLLVTDDDEVVAADVAEEGAGGDSETAMSSFRASVTMNSSPRAKPYASLTALNPSMSQ